MTLAGAKGFFLHLMSRPSLVMAVALNTGHPGSSKDQLTSPNCHFSVYRDAPDRRIPLESVMTERLHWLQFRADVYDHGVTRF